MLLVLRTPWADEATLRSNLSRLVISLETHIVNTISDGPEGTGNPAHDVIFSGTVQDMDDPFIIVDESEAGSEGSEAEVQEQHVYAIWKMSVFLARPRLRLRQPVAHFTASAGLRPAGRHTPTSDGGYLPSGVPAGMNLLEPFGADPVLRRVKPRLSALRVSRVAPVTQKKEDVQPIPALKELSFDIAPAIHSRVRVSRPTTHPASPVLVAVLEVDFAGDFTCDITIDKITADLRNGSVEDLNNQPGFTLLPMTCVAHDHITFLYSLTPSDPDDIAKNPIRDLAITINATAALAPTCTPKFTLAWTTPVDFTIPVNPGFAPATQPIQRSHRPSHLSLGALTETFTAPSASRPDSLPSFDAAAASSRSEASLPNLGITMTFTASPHPVRPGEVFSWKIYTVNRTQEKNPRKLAILALPRRKRPARVVRPPSLPQGGSLGANEDLADAVLDENVVHAMHKNSAVDAADIVCLSSEVRVGPLAPGTCHVAELEFLAVREGVLAVEAVRVVDLGSQEHVDIRDLPVVVVEKGA